MDRRRFLNRLGTGLAAGGTVAVTAASTLRNNDSVQKVSNLMRNELDGMSARLRKLEKDNRRLTKALLLVATVSTGVDVYALVDPLG